MPHSNHPPDDPYPDSAEGTPTAPGPETDRATAWYRPLFSFASRVPASDACGGGGGTGPGGGVGWDDILPRLTVALDPIFGTHSGRLLGVEAVIANAADFGVETPQALMDLAFDSSRPDDPLRADNRLPDVEDAVHAAALALFARIPRLTGLKLFLPCDMRRLAQASAVVDALKVQAQRWDVPVDGLIPALSGRLPVFASGSVPPDPEDEARNETEAEARETRVSAFFKDLRGLSGRLAVARFGAGAACLPLLTLARPEFVRLDRFFLRAGPEARSRKLVLNTLANLCNLMGSQVIATGVTSAEDYHLCRAAGLARDCETVRALNDADQRTARGDAALIASQTQALAPITRGTPMAQVFERFRQVKDQTFLPTVDKAGEPVGIIRERDLKEYTYSLYGKDLLSNRALGRTLDGFLVPCPIADVNTKAERILDLFSAAESAECVLITRDSRYIGFLSAASLLKVIGEKNLAMARDQNPLSRLPGNAMINEYIAEALTDPTREAVMVYLDFDHFKPFNDTYGYRQGDRAITLFAELLRKALPQADVFIGHVGGDDFFVGFKDFEPAHVDMLIADLIERFRRDVESFYDEETRRAGHMVARDRDGVERCLPLLTASAAIIEVPRGHATRSADEIAGLIAQYKKEAKRTPGGIARGRVAPPTP